MKTDQVFLDKFNQLKKDFAAKLPARLEEIKAALQDCMVRPQDADQFERLYRLLHSLAGTAGTFGFKQIGLDARKIEGQIKVLMHQGLWSRQDLVRIAEALATLQQDNRVFLIPDGHENSCPLDKGGKHVSPSSGESQSGASSLGRTTGECAALFCLSRIAPNG